MVGLVPALLLVAFALTAVDAGVLPRYRNGYTPPVRWRRLQVCNEHLRGSTAPELTTFGVIVQERREEDLSHNHQPAKLLQAHRLPRKFDWYDPLDLKSRQRQWSRAFRSTPTLALSFFQSACSPERISSNYVVSIHTTSLSSEMCAASCVIICSVLT